MEKPRLQPRKLLSHGSIHRLIDVKKAGLLIVGISVAVTAFSFGLIALILLALTFLGTALAIQADLEESSERCDHRLRAAAMLVLAEAHAIDQRLDDPHGDGSGRDAQPPTGDEYNELCSVLDGLRKVLNYE